MTGYKEIYRIWSGSLKAALSLASCLVMVLYCGCTKSPAEPVKEDDAAYIDFSSFAPVTKTGAGDTITDTDDKLRQQPFGIFGSKHISGSSSLHNVFLSDAAQEVGWGTEGSGETAKQCWTYSPKRKWEMSMDYRFRAYWPYSAEINPSSDASRLAVEYKSTTQQYDLLVAHTTRSPRTEGIGTVKMQFHHALSALRFEFKYKDEDETKGLTDYVTEFYLKGIYTVGTLMYGYFGSDTMVGLTNASVPSEDNMVTPLADEDTLADEDPYEKIEWYKNFNTFDSTSELFYWSGERRFHAAADATDTNETASVFDGDALVLIVPQTLSEGSRKTYANFKLRGAGDALHTVALPTEELLPGKIYTYTLVISSSYITIDITIKDWETIQSNVDINL